MKLQTNVCDGYSTSNVISPAIHKNSTKVKGIVRGPRDKMNEAVKKQGIIRI